MRRNKRVISLLGGSMLCMQAVAAGAGEIALSTGAEFSRGDYGGTDDIDEVYVPVQLRYMNERYGVSLTVPYVSVSAPAGALTDTTSAGTETQSGLGDVIAGGTLYDVWMSPKKAYSLDLGAKVKFGTADEDKGLGTGENDYAASATLYRWYSHAALYVSGGYRWRTDPADVDYENSATAGVGGSYRFSPATSVGASYDWREAALDWLDDPRELTVYLSHRFNPAWRLKTYAFGGFNDSSPDWGAGLLLEWRTQMADD